MFRELVIRFGISLVGAIASAAIMEWVVKSRQRSRTASERNTLVQPVATLVVGIVAMAFFGGLALVSNTIAKNPTATVWTTLGFTGIALLGLVLIAEYYFARHRVSEHGMEYGRMLGPRGELLWSDVREVRYVPSMKWFLLTLHDGTRVRISTMLMGLPEFAEILLEHVPEEAIDPTTLPVLQKMARGELPDVWGR